MSQYELVPDATYDNLPQDPHDKFVAIVNVAQANLARLLDQTGSSDFAEEIRSQFISTISGAAEALGVEGLPTLSSDIADFSQFQKFQVYLAGVVMRVRLQSQLVSRPYSVALGRVTKARIQQEIDTLRLAISNSDLPQPKQASLIAKLDELQDELAKTRLGFAKMMAIAASIMTVVGGGTATLANCPKAAETVATIIALIGEDKAREETERLRLMPPPKAIPILANPLATTLDDLDEDVPF